MRMLFSLRRLPRFVKHSQTLILLRLLQPPEPPGFFLLLSMSLSKEIVSHKILLVGLLAHFLCEECLDIFLPSRTKLVNCSFSESVVPEGFKKAVVIPRLFVMMMT